MEGPEPLWSSTCRSAHHLGCRRANLQDMAENYKKDLIEKVNKDLAVIARYGPETLGAILLDVHNSLQNLDKYMGWKETENQVEATINCLKASGDKMLKMAENLRKMDISEYELDIEKYIADKEKEEVERAMEATKVKDQSLQSPKHNLIPSIRQRMRSAIRAVTRTFTGCFNAAPTSGED